MNRYCEFCRKEVEFDEGVCPVCSAYYPELDVEEEIEKGFEIAYANIVWDFAFSTDVKRILLSLTNSQKQSIELSLMHVYKDFNEQGLVDFWERAIDLGFINGNERLVNFASEFHDLAKSIDANREKINSYQAKERHAMRKNLWDD